jgi:hypothetical protein
MSASGGKRIRRAAAAEGRTCEFQYNGNKMKGKIVEIDRSDDHVKMYVYTDTADPMVPDHRRQGFAVWVPVANVVLP